MKGNWFFYLRLQNRKLKTVPDNKNTSLVDFQQLQQRKWIAQVNNYDNVAVPLQNKSLRRKPSIITGMSNNYHLI